MADVALQQILHTAGKEPLSTTNGALHTQIRGTDGLAPHTIKTDTGGRLVVSPDSALATEATITAINTALGTLNSNVSTEAKLEAVRILVEAISQKDFATETTLAQVLTKLSGDPATATKQDSVKAVLDAISTAVAARATEQTLGEIKTALTDGTQQVQLTGNVVDLLECNSTTFPVPATIQPQFSEYGDYVPKWVNDGDIYATVSGSAIRKSSDGGNTWVEVFYQSGFTSTYGDGWYRLLMVTATGRVIFGTAKGYVFVSDENEQNFTEAFQFTSGFASQWFGGGQYENLVWIPAYSGGGVDGNEVYLSTDSGATFTKVASLPKHNEDKVLHIHDMEFDPYAKRFWLCTGDLDNSNLYYSDNLCQTWVPVFGPHGVDPANVQLTSISIFPHGVVLGTDSAFAPDGLLYWPRPTVSRQPVVDGNTVRRIYSFRNDNNLRVWAGKSRRSHLVDGRIITLIPWYAADASTPPCLLATTDGLHWWEIWSSQIATEKAFTIAGGQTLTASVVGAVQDTSTSPQWRVWTATLPKFVRHDMIGNVLP